MSVVDRSKLPSIVLIVVAILALSATAATIDNTVGGPSGSGITVDPNGGGGGPPPADDGGSEPGTGEPEDLDTTAGGTDFQVCIEFLTQPTAVLGIFAFMGVFFYGIQRRWNGATAMLVGTGVVPVVMGTYFFVTNCQNPGEGGGGGGGGIPSPDPGAGLSAPNVPPTVLGAALVGVLGLAAVMLYAVTGDDEEFEPLEEDDADAGPDKADFAEAAGRAADRIEEANVEVDNAVYRAWYEMTQLLDIPDPATSSPMDFAEAAIDFGLDEDDVTELTDLFNEVRYGNEDAESREERALEILRHIESEYESP